MSTSVSLSRLSFRPEISNWEEGMDEEVPTKSAGDFNQMETSPEGIRTLDLLWKAANLGPPEWVSEEWARDRLRPAL